MNPYNILNLKSDCTKNEIRNAYKILALKYHPDKNKHNKKESEIQFKKISEAYQILYNDDRRLAYDLNGNIGNNVFIDPEKLFETMFKDINPKIVLYIKNIISDFQTALNITDTKNILDVLNNMNKEKILDDSFNLIKNYFITHISKNVNINTSNTSISKSINIKELGINNNIYISLNNLYCNKMYSINIVDEDTLSTFKLNTEYSIHKISINNKIYHFKICDILDNTYKRINSYDLLTSINISIKDYFNHFNLILEHFKQPINLNINLIRNKSTILKLENYGLPIWSKNIYGDLYINFNILNINNRLQKAPTSKSFKYSNEISNIIENVILYN